MTEPDNNPEFDPSTDSDAPVEETAPETPVEESTPDAPAPAEESVSDASVEDPAPTEVSPEDPDTDTTEVTDGGVVVDPDAPDLNAAPVSGVPSPAAVSDVPVQTDNSERPEDGEQDVSQDPTEVPSDDEDPDVVA